MRAARPEKRTALGLRRTGYVVLSLLLASAFGLLLARRAQLQGTTAAEVSTQTPGILRCKFLPHARCVVCTFWVLFSNISPRGTLTRQVRMHARHYAVTAVEMRDPHRSQRRPL